MVWGSVSLYDMGNLHICKGTNTDEKYIQNCKYNSITYWRK